MANTRFALGVCLVALCAQAASAIEVAGTLFVDLDASTFNTGDSTWLNSGTYTDFDTVGDPMRIMVSDATPAILFDGVDDAFVGQDFAPEGIVGAYPTRSIEAWVLNEFVASEETIVSFGRRGGPEGSNMAFNYGNNGMYGAVGHWGGGTADIGWIDNDFTAGSPERNLWHHLVYTFDGDTTRVYSDGELWNEEETSAVVPDIFTWDDTPIAVASQWEADAVTLTGGLKGSLAIGRLRIHDEVLTDQQILSNFNEEKSAFVDPGVVVITPEQLTSGPINRYSFSNAASNDASGATLLDSVSGANGIVIGDGASFTGTSLVLDGGTSDFAAYGDLPNGLISAHTDATIEAWVTVDGAQNWSRIFDFGSSEPGGEDGEIDDVGDTNGAGNAGLDYIFLSASIGADTNAARVEIRDEDPAGGGITTIDVPGVGPTPSEEVHYAVVYDSDGGPTAGGPIIKVYRDGELIGQGETAIELSDINDVNNWLGRSNWTADSNFQGSFDEFRIYDYALNQGQVVGNFEAGPDTVNLELLVTGDINGDGAVDSTDIDLLATAIRDNDMSAIYDMNGDGSVDSLDRDFWVHDLKNTYYGDANLDGEFNSSDFVAVFQLGEYEDGVALNSGWAEGDWNGDADFTSGDFVVAFQDGGFELGPKGAVSSVPEPSAVLLLLVGGLGLLSRRQSRG